MYCGLCVEELMTRTSLVAGFSSEPLGSCAVLLGGCDSALAFCSAAFTFALESFSAGWSSVSEPEPSSSPSRCSLLLSTGFFSSAAGGTAGSGKCLGSCCCCRTWASNSSIFLRRATISAKPKVGWLICEALGPNLGKQAAGPPNFKSSCNKTLYSEMLLKSSLMAGSRGAFSFGLAGAPDCRETSSCPSIRVGADLRTGAGRREKN